jgi:DNA-binding MarR family transcriptional regulator
MDPQDIRTLQLLEEIEKNNTPSQRELAQQLNVSLGLVNSFVKRLSAKGYFKVTNIPKKRIRYIMTPKGFAEKSRLTYDYIRFSYSFYKDARVKLRRLFKELEEAGVKKVAFYGAGDLAEIAYLSLQETTIEFAAITDENVKGKKFLNHRLKSLDSIKTIPFDRIIITSDQVYPDTVKRIEKKGIAKGKIIVIE